MNTIILILIVAVSFLYLKWLFVILFYPLMVLSAIGSCHSNPKSKKILQFPLRVAEHFLRFGGGKIYPLSDRVGSVCASSHMAV